MSHLQVAMIRSIQGFATELTRARLYDCGHADAWELVERAGTIEDLLLALGYCAGYADCARIACTWDSRAWRIADTLSVAARTLAVAVRTLEPIDLDGCVGSYRAELHGLLAGDVSEQLALPHH
jgi:hypothetical protein